MFQEVSIEEQAFNANNLTFGDDRLGVKFYLRVVEDVEGTKREGRRVFMQQEWVRVMTPGDRLNVIDRKVQVTGIVPSDDRMRWPKQYALFKQQQDQPVHDGTPLALWPIVPPTLVEELKYINVYTVEQLAELADTFIVQIPRGQEWKRRAREFVAALKDQGVVGKLQSELADRDSQIAALQQAVKDQAERLEALAKKVK
jgi:hypothetical protein